MHWLAWINFGDCFREGFLKRSSRQRCAHQQYEIPALQLSERKVGDPDVLGFVRAVKPHPANHAHNLEHTRGRIISVGIRCEPFPDRVLSRKTEISGSLID